jgi:hypothetical protein
MRGRHQSSCPEGKKTLLKLQKIEGVSAVVLGFSIGGKSIRGAPTGFFRIQSAVPGGFKGILQSSKGVQEVFVKVAAGKENLVRLQVENIFC